MAPGVKRFGPWSLAPFFEYLPQRISTSQQEAHGDRDTAHLTLTRKHAEREIGRDRITNAASRRGPRVLISSQYASPLDRFTTIQKDLQLILGRKHMAYGSDLTQLRTPGNPSKLALALFYREDAGGTFSRLHSEFGLCYTLGDLLLRRLSAQLRLCTVLKIPCKREP